MNNLGIRHCESPKPLAALLFPAVILIAGLIVYANSFSGAFVFDDLHFILENREIRSLWPLWQILETRRPIVNLTLAINHAISGLDPWGFHALNVMIHLAAALTLFGLVRRTLRRPPVADRFRNAADWLAFGVALLWTVHPLQTQSVSYLTQRSESLMGLFYLLTVYCVIRGAASARGGVWYAGAVIACALSIGSKAVAVTAPLTVLLYDRMFLSTSLHGALRTRWRLYVGLAATWSVLIVTGVLRGVLNPGATSATVGFGFKGISPLEYALTQPGVILHYLILSCWPHPLCLDYAWPVASSVSGFVFPALVVIGVALLSVWAYSRRWAVGWVGLSFLIILAPTSSVVPIKDPLVEHRMYLPLAAVLTLYLTGLHVGLSRLPRLRWQFDRGAARASAGLLTIGGCVLGYVTMERNQDYRHAISIWRDVVVKRPSNVRGWDNLGSALTAAGLPEEAVKALHRGLQVDRDNVQVLANLGSALSASGRDEDAVEVLKRAIELDPDRVDALTNLGAVRLKEGRVDEALTLLRRAAALEPDYANAQRNLGVALFQKGEIDGSIAALMRTIELAPHFEEAHHNLDVALSALVKSGRGGEAVDLYRQVVKRVPSRIRSRVKLANLLFELGRLDEAVETYRGILRLDPGLAGVYFNLGIAYQQQGRVAAAIEALHKAVTLEPDYAEAHFHLGKALARAGKLSEAEREYRATLDSNPNHRAARAALQALLRQSGP